MYCKCDVCQVIDLQTLPVNNKGGTRFVECSSLTYVDMCPLSNVNGLFCLVSFKVSDKTTTRTNEYGGLVCNKRTSLPAVLQVHRIDLI